MSAHYSGPAVGPGRGSMSNAELRARIALGDMSERDLDELLLSVARILGTYRLSGTATAERRVLLRRMWPELGHALDALDRGPQL
jgi:hypothetical protein